MRLPEQAPGKLPESAKDVVAEYGDSYGRVTSLYAAFKSLIGTEMTEVAEKLGLVRTGESGDEVFYDCPNHQSISGRSLHVNVRKGTWICRGCGIGGTLIDLVEFVQSGVVTRGAGSPSHRAARTWLASESGIQLPDFDEEKLVGAVLDRQPVYKCMAEFMRICHESLLGNDEILKWFQSGYAISMDTVRRLQIGFAGEPNIVSMLRKAGFSDEIILGTGLFYRWSNGRIGFCHMAGRIVFPYWKNGSVVYAIGRQTPLTPPREDPGTGDRFPAPKYVKLLTPNEKHPYVAYFVRNNVFYNEDILVGKNRPDHVIISEGVTDCIALMDSGFPTISPVTVQFPKAEYGRLAAMLKGMTVYVYMDNEVSCAGLKGAISTARMLESHGVEDVRIMEVPLGEKQIAARAALKKRFGIEPGFGFLDGHAIKHGIGHNS